MGDARRRRAIRAVCAIGVMAGTASGCASTIDGTAGAPAAEVSAYQSDRSVAQVSAVRTAGVELCRQAMSSMVVMVDGYNAFARRLNVTHDYAGVGDLDDKARASLIAGADQIRAKLTASAPGDVVVPANAFLDSSGRLGSAIAAHRLTGLNPVADRWTRDKATLLDRCGVYLPLPPASSATAVPTPTP